MHKLKKSVGQVKGKDQEKVYIHAWIYEMSRPAKEQETNKICPASTTH